MKRVPQFAPYVGNEEYESIKACFDENWITEGPKAKEFADKLCGFLGVRYGVFAPNGTLALFLGLRALGIRAGDEVIVPDCTFIGSATAVELAGGTPVFVDVNRRNYQIDVGDCERVVSDKTRAIMPVHLYGMAANMNELMEFARRRDLFVIEDAAQAIGVTYYGKHCGTFGEVGCFSFFADKTITTGEGGLVVTDNEDLHRSLLYLRNQGRVERGTFIHPEIGYNFRMTDVQMAIGLSQFAKFSEIRTKKEQVYELYRKQLEGIKEVRFTEIEPGSGFIPFRVTIICEEAYKLMDHLALRGVEPRTFFYPLHKQPCFQYLRHQQDWWRPLDDKYFANAIHGYDNGVCLPSFASLKGEEVTYVCDVIKEYYGRN